MISSASSQGVAWIPFALSVPCANIYYRQAYEIRADIGRQRGALSGIQTCMTGVLSM